MKLDILLGTKQQQMGLREITMKGNASSCPSLTAQTKMGQPFYTSWLLNCAQINLDRRTLNDRTKFLKTNDEDDLQTPQETN